MARDLRYWDRVSGKPYTVLERVVPHAEFGRLAVRVLGLRPGHRVLDVGCGTGMNLPALREAVGPDGHVHGVDYSQKMVARARARVATHGWDNVTVAHGDATRTELEPNAYDAVLASFAISAMQDVPAAVANIHGALRPGGHLFAPDMRLVPAGPSAPLTWTLGWIYRLFARWTGVDVLDTVHARFGEAWLVNGEGERLPHVPAAAPVVLIHAVKNYA